LPPVQVLLTVVASIATLLGGDHPGEVDGQVVPAEMVRQLLRGLTGHAAAAESAAVDAGATEADARPWQEIEQEQLENWLTELDQRLQADDLDSQPDPAPDTVGTGATPPTVAPTLTCSAVVPTPTGPPTPTGSTTPEDPVGATGRSGCTIPARRRRR